MEYPFTLAALLVVAAVVLWAVGVSPWALAFGFLGSLLVLAWQRRRQS